MFLTPFSMLNILPSPYEVLYYVMERIEHPGKEDSEPKECDQGCERPELYNLTAPPDLKIVDGGKCADCEYPYLQKRIENQRKSIYDLTQKNERLAKRVQELEHQHATLLKGWRECAQRADKTSAEARKRLQELEQDAEEIKKRNAELNREISKRDEAKRAEQVVKQPLPPKPSPPSPEEILRHYGFCPS